MKEFYLKFWGQIEADGYATEQLGTENRDFWFDSEGERDAFRKRGWI